MTETQYGVYVVDTGGRAHYVESYATRREADAVAAGLNRNPQTTGYYYTISETSYAMSVEGRED